jgi:hypothetical protein
MSVSNTVIVKFVGAGNAAAQLERIRKVVGRERVKDARQLFPGDEEQNLASLFEVELDDSVSLNQALAALNSDEDVEYAHLPQSRKAF